MSLALLLAAVFLAGTVQPTPPRPASASELNSVAKAVRGFAPKDQFDSPPAHRSFADRQFIIDAQPWGTTPPKMACFGYPMWSYSQESGTLYVSTGASKLVLSGFLTKQG